MTQVIVLNQLYERGQVMSNEYEEVGTTPEETSEEKKSIKEIANTLLLKYAKWLITIGSTAIIAFMGICARFIFDYYSNRNNIAQIPEMVATVNSVKDDINNLTQSIENLNEDLSSEIDKTNDKLTEVIETTAALEQAQKDYEKILPYARSPYEFFPNAFSSFGFTYEGSEDIYSLNEPTWKSAEIIACDRHTMQEYSAKDLEGELLLVPYFEDGQEIYFKGRYNNNNLWEGNCLINAYKNNKLSLIMDAYYENGVLKEYKQVMPFTTAQGEEVWAISDRKNNGFFNSGVTWTYRKTNEYLKEFDMETVTYGDVKSVEDFKKSITLSLEGFYHGNTSDGKFNDETGEAYLVKYFPDGTVRTLYSGRFKNGMPNDNSGQAWCISKNAEDDEYYFRNDIYINGDPQHKNKYEVLTQEKLQTLLKDRIFECDLTGLVDEKTV